MSFRPGPPLTCAGTPAPQPRFIDGSGFSDQACSGISVSILYSKAVTEGTTCDLAGSGAGDVVI